MQFDYFVIVFKIYSSAFSKSVKWSVIGQAYLLIAIIGKLSKDFAQERHCGVSGASRRLTYAS